MMWGVEDLSEAEWFAAAVRAGTDIFSDMANPAQLIAAVEQGHLDASELDQPAARLLTEIFSLGLFENPYVDAARAASVIGAPEISALGERAAAAVGHALQRRRRRSVAAPARPTRQGLPLRHGFRPRSTRCRASWKSHCGGMANR